MTPFNAEFNIEYTKSFNSATIDAHSFTRVRFKFAIEQGRVAADKFLANARTLATGVAKSRFRFAAKLCKDLSSVFWYRLRFRISRVATCRGVCRGRFGLGVYRVVRKRFGKVLPSFVAS